MSGHQIRGLVSNLQNINNQLEYFEVERFKLERQENVNADMLLKMNMGIETHLKLKKECEENIKNQRNIIRKSIDEKYKNKTLDDTITDIAIELAEKLEKIKKDNYSRGAPLGKYYDQQFVIILEALFISLKSIS